MKNKRKTLKGMTLMEIIISLAILAVLTLVLVQTSTAINKYSKSAKNINQTVAEQAPVAQMGYKEGAIELTTSAIPEVFVNWGANTVTSSDASGTYVVTGTGIAMDAVAYQVGEIATTIVYETVAGGTETVTRYEEANPLGGNLAMQFLEVHDPVIATTTTATTAVSTS